MIEEMRGPNYFCSRTGPSWTPRVNMYETSTHLLLCVELAGIRAEDLEVNLTAGRILISGNRQRPIFPTGFADAEDQVGVHLMEIDSGRYCREIELPCAVQTGEVQGLYRQGLLWIIAPRKHADPGVRS
jgi:HSP20 family protein